MCFSLGFDNLSSGSKVWCRGLRFHQESKGLLCLLVLLGEALVSSLGLRGAGHGVSA